VRAPVAALQTGPADDGPEAAVARAEALCRAATATGARLLVLPELFPFRPGEIAADPSSAARLSTAALEQLARLARDEDLHLVLSLVEAADAAFHSTAYLLGPAGVLGRYQQAHVWPADRAWATAGDDYPVFATPHGRIGLMVGYDGLFPEVARVLALREADIVAYPTTWRVPWEPALTAVERAAENHVHVVAAARPDSPVQRGSLLVPVDRFPTQPHWWLRSPRPSEIAPGDAQFLTGSLATSHARDKTIFYNTNLVAHRRPTLYGTLLEAPREPALAEDRRA
jgi:predicted amidohydrolase